MDGKNSSGRRISLLNDITSPPQPCRYPSFTPSLRSRTSSYTSSPVNSPPTPQLVRSNSSDSTVDMQTPSPITPEFNFDDAMHPHHHHHHHPNLSPVFATNSFFPAQKSVDSHYPSMSNSTGPLPYHSGPPAQAAYFRPQQQQQQQQQQQVQESHTAQPNSRTKKNSYPCPVAKQYNCSDYFTTSGHAARHAKKHTGKKDAFCPECNKAFTRKDNMEQHRRTHQSGRNAAKGGDLQVKKAKQAARRPKLDPLQKTEPSSSAMSMLDPALTPSGNNFSIAPAVQPADFFGDYSQRSPYADHTMTLAYSYPTGINHGLDALAIAASGEKRKHES